jgi:hypothetical protein
MSDPQAIRPTALRAPLAVIVVSFVMIVIPFVVSPSNHERTSKSTAS